MTGRRGLRRNCASPSSTRRTGKIGVFRPKDLTSWWSLAHHSRIDGVRAAVPTGWCREASLSGSPNMAVLP